jgi:hypothetical protein
LEIIMKHSFEIIDVVVLKTTGTDKIVVKYVGPPQYPNWLPDESPSFSMETAKDQGVEYAKNMFGIEPKVIDTR